MISLYNDAFYELLSGDSTDIYSAFECAIIQVHYEVKSISAFAFDNKVYIKIKEIIENNADNIKEIEYIITMNDYMEQEYGRKIF